MITDGVMGASPVSLSEIGPGVDETIARDGAVHVGVYSLDGPPFVRVRIDYPTRETKGEELAFTAGAFPRLFSESTLTEKSPDASDMRHGRILRIVRRGGWPYPPRVIVDTYDGAEIYVGGGPVPVGGV